MTSRIQAALTVVMVPWNAFVAAFLYYVLLAAVALAGVSPSSAVVGTAYLAPVVAYAVTVAFRGFGVAAQRLRGTLRLRAIRGH